VTISSKLSEYGEAEGLQRSSARRERVHPAGIPFERRQARHIEHFLNGGFLPKAATPACGNFSKAAETWCRHNQCSARSSREFRA